MYIYIYIYCKAGGHRGPGGSVAIEDTPRGLCKPTCVTYLDGKPIKWGP